MQVSVTLRSIYPGCGFCRRRDGPQSLSGLGGGKVPVPAGNWTRPLSISWPGRFSKLSQFFPVILRLRWSWPCSRHEGAWGSWGMASLIIIPGTGGGEWLAVRPGRFAPRRRNRSCLLSGKLRGLQRLYGRFGEGNLLPFAEIELWFLGRPACSLVTILTEPFRLVPKVVLNETGREVISNLSAHNLLSVFRERRLWSVSWRSGVRVVNAVLHLWVL